MKRALKISAIILGSIFTVACANQNAVNQNPTTMSMTNGAITGAVSAALQNGASRETIKQGAINGAVTGLVGTNTTTTQPQPLPKKIAPQENNVK